MSFEICVAAVVIICLILVVYFLLFSSRRVTWKKTSQGANTSLKVNVGRDIRHVSLVAKFGGEKITFHRTRIKKGETVEFVYPSSEEPAILTVEVESGNARVYRV